LKPFLIPRVKTINTFTENLKNSKCGKKVGRLKMLAVFVFHLALASWGCLNDSQKKVDESEEKNTW